MLFLLYKLGVLLINWLISLDWVSIVEPILVLLCVITGTAIMVSVIGLGTGRVVTWIYRRVFRILWRVVQSIFHFIRILLIYLLHLIPRFFRWSRRTLRGWGLGSILSNVLGLILTIIFVIILI